MGEIEKWTTCPQSLQRYVRKGVWYGRVTVNSSAFLECFDAAVRTGIDGIGPYRKCTDDPYFSSTVDEQLTRAMAIVRSPSPLQIECANYPYWGETDWQSYEYKGSEEVRLGAWLRDTYPMFGTMYEVRDLIRLASTVWHEVLHQHGYIHAETGKADTDAIECGYERAEEYDSIDNSMPYIVDGCIGRVLRDAKQTCGIMERCSYNKGLLLPDHLGSTTCQCVQDPRPDVIRPPDDDADHDGMRDNKDNCPYAFNPEQENCNIDSERARRVTALGDVCDPVPCPRTEIPRTLSNVTCAPNPPPAQDSQACSGVRSQDRWLSTPIGPYVVNGSLYRDQDIFGSVYGVPTSFRYCQDNVALARNCMRDDVLADFQLNHFPSAEVERFDDEHPWHRMTIGSGVRGATEEWNYNGGKKGSFGSPFPGRYERQWAFAVDVPFWVDNPNGATIWTPPNNSRCVNSAGQYGGCLEGAYWIHAETAVGATQPTTGGSDPTQYGLHGSELANTYMYTKPFDGEIAWCPMPSSFLHPSEGLMSSGLGASTALNVSSLLWRDTGERRRIDLRTHADTELIVRTTYPTGVFGALQDSGSVVALQGSKLSNNCGADSMTSTLASGLQTVPYWLSAVEPSSSIGSLSANVMAVGLTPRYRSVVDAALVSNANLISVHELSGSPGAAIQAPSMIAGQVDNQNATVSSEDEIIGGGQLPSDRDGWIPILSRAAEGIFLVASTPSELWFKRLGAAHAWAPLNGSLLPPSGNVLAATYSFQDRRIWLMHQAPNDASICLFRIDPWDDTTDGTTRHKVGCWNYSGGDIYLSVDREGDVLLTISHALDGGPTTATARIRFDDDGNPFISGTSVDAGILAYPPIVSPRSYAFVVEDGNRFVIRRRESLEATSTPLAAFQTYMGKTCKNLGVSAGVASPQPVGVPVTFTASSVCDSGVSAEYRFWLQAPNHDPELVRDWGSNSYTWSTENVDGGSYVIRVDMRRLGSQREADEHRSETYVITSPFGQCAELRSWLTPLVIEPTGRVQLHAEAACSLGAVPEC